LNLGAIKPASALVIGGDGRYHNSVAIQTVIKMSIANGIYHLYVGKNGLLSTPAVSLLVRKLNEEGVDCVGAITLSASHNPGGKDHDFGIKLNDRKGAPLLDEATKVIYQLTQQISSYKIRDAHDFCL